MLTLLISKLIALLVFYDLICLIRSFKVPAYLSCLVLLVVCFSRFSLLGLKIILNPMVRNGIEEMAIVYKVISMLSDSIVAVASAIIDHRVIESRIKKFRSDNVYCIPYGGDHVCPNSLSHAKTQFQNGSIHKMSCVCRIEPENNIHLCLKACMETNTP